MLWRHSPAAAAFHKPGVLTSRPEYYYVVVAVSALTLSPALVLWTGIWSVIGLAGATAWIMARMESAVGLGDLPPTPSPQDYLAVVLNPDFLGLCQPCWSKLTAPYDWPSIRATMNTGRIK